MAFANAVASPRGAKAPVRPPSVIFFEMERDVAYHRRQTAGHGFQQRIAGAFPSAAQHEQIRCPAKQFNALRRYLSEKMYARDKPWIGGDEVFDFSQQGRFMEGTPKANARVLPGYPRHRRQNGERVLVRIEAPYPQQRRVAVNPMAAAPMRDPRLKWAGAFRNRDDGNATGQ